MRINYSKLPRRISIRWDSKLHLMDNHLGTPRARRFYVRQNPKAPSLTATEAAGFRFDMEKSLDQDLGVKTGLQSGADGNS